MHNHKPQDFHPNLDPERLKPLFKINSFKHAGDILLNWIIILAAIYYCQSVPNLLTYFLAIIIIGARMHALAILMHDATHFRFLKNRYWNDLLSDVFIMYPIFLTIEKYRINHLAHHKHLNTDHDPDWVSKLPMKEFQFPKTKKQFVAGVLSYFLLIQGVKDAIWFVKRFNVLGPNKNPTKKGNPIPQLLFYGFFIALFSVFSLWQAFLLFWIVPYFSTFLMFQYIRSVSEHFGDLAYDHELNGSRTVKTNAVERFFIAPHNVGYHLEHHLYSGIPYYNLPKLHQLLMEIPTFKANAHITQGYFNGLLKELGT